MQNKKFVQDWFDIMLHIIAIITNVNLSSTDFIFGQLNNELVFY